MISNIFSPMTGAAALLVLPMLSSAAELSTPNTFFAGTPALAEEVNANFSAAEAALNDNHSRIQALEQAGDDLTRVQYLSWAHGDSITASAFANTGIVVYFSRPVLIGDLLANTSTNLVAEVYYRNADSVWQRFLNLQAEAVSAVEFNANNVILNYTPDLSGDPLAAGIAFTPSGVQGDPDFGWLTGLYKVVIRGDFVADETGRALDTDFLLGKLPTGDNIPGGTFESWFVVGN